MQTIPPVPDFPVVPEAPNPLDPRNFFLGAPSVEDQSPTARLIHEARERALRSGSRTVRFTPMNLFAIKKEESVTLPDGRRYSLSSYWIEEPSADLSKEVACQTSP